MRKFLPKFSYLIKLYIFTLLVSVTLPYINQVSASTSNFITTNGRNFYLNGQIFKSIGVNRYNLMTIGGNPYIGCGGKFTDSDLNTWFSELRQMGVTTARFWLFQSFTKSGTDFNRFNYLLSLSQQYNVKLIPVFENQAPPCRSPPCPDPKS